MGSCPRIIGGSVTYSRCRLDFGPLDRLFTGCVAILRVAPKAGRKGRFAVLALANRNDCAPSALPGTPLAGLVFDCESNLSQEQATFVASFVHANTVFVTNCLLLLRCDLHFFPSRLWQLISSKLKFRVLGANTDSSGAGCGASIGSSGAFKNISSSDG